MTQQRDTRLTLGGLVTQPNKFLAEPGSLSVAQNVMSRQPGVVEPRIAFENIADPGGVSPATPRMIAALEKGDILTFFDESSGALHAAYRTDSVGSSVAVLDESASAFNTRGCVAEARERVFIDARASSSPSPEMVRVIDPADTDLARRAGLVPPSIVEVFNSVPGTAVNGTVGYRAHFERKHEDGYIQIGPVGPVTIYTGSSENPNVSVRFARAISTDWVKVGDLVRLYRTDNADSVDTVGDTMRLTSSATVTSSDITNGFVALPDVTEDAGLGAFLYTNSGQGSLDENKWFPPSAADMIAFRNVMWYATPFALSTLSYRIPGVWGTALTADAKGASVGAFQITGDLTNASAVITNIADTTGLAVGQKLVTSTSGDLAIGVTILSKGPTSITVSTAASGDAVAEVFTFIDRIQVDGNIYDCPSPGHLAHNMAVAVPSAVDQAWIFYDRPITYNASTFLDDHADGIEAVFVAPAFFTFGIERKWSIKATNGDRYSPPFPTWSQSPEDFGSCDPRNNRMHFSEIEEYEAVPPLNYRFFGHGALYKAIAVETSMIAFCSDGTYACDGDGQNWDIRELDLSLKLLHRNAVDKMDGAVWALTNKGVVVVAGGAVQEVSTPYIGNRIREIEQQFASYMEPRVDPAAPAKTLKANSYGIWLRCDPYHSEVWVTWGAPGFFVNLIYNVSTKTWTEVTSGSEGEAPTAMAYDSTRRSMILGRGRPTINPNGFQTLRASYPDNPTDPADIPAQRMRGARWKLNPWGGSATDLNTRKEFLEAVYDLEFLLEFPSATSALKLLPFFNDEIYPNSYTLAVRDGDCEHVVKVQRNAARGKQLAPGFAVTGTVATDDAAAWKCSGVTIKYRVASPDTRRQ